MLFLFWAFPSAALSALSFAPLRSAKDAASIANANLQTGTSVHKKNKPSKT